MNYLLTIEYEGTRYEGWQRQKKTTQTIQGKLEQVLSRMTEKEIEIDGAGRTDAGFMRRIRQPVCIWQRNGIRRRFCNI